MKTERDLIRDLANELDILDDMLTSLVEVLEEKTTTLEQS